MSPRTQVNERIAARRAEVVAARRRRLRRRVGLVALVVALVVGAVALERSSLVALVSVEVEGTERLEPATVRSAVGVEPGTSVLRIDTGDVRDRVEALPLVERATVDRVGALGLRVSVTEVAPALTVRYDERTVLVDRAGLVLGEGSAPGTPVVRLPGAAPAAGARVTDDPLLAVAHEVVLSLPGPLAALVEHTTGDRPDDLSLRLGDGTTVRWGDETRSDEKARSLGAVLEDLDGRTVTAIDVRAPGAPTVTP